MSSYGLEDYYGKRRRRINKQAFREGLAGYLFAAPWIVGFLVFVLGPMLSSLYLSFTKYDVIQEPTWVGIRNYVNIFTSDDLFWKSLYNTLYYTLFSVPLAVAGSFILAILLNNKLRGISIYRAVFYIPSVTTGVALALLWMWVFDPGAGIINNLLSYVGIKGPMWFKDEFWAKPFMILIGLWAIGGTRCVVFLAGLQGLPQDLYEAAAIDGANWWAKLRHVTIPLLSPVILFNIIISMLFSFRVFTNAKVITEGGPLNSTLFYVLYLYQVAFRWLKMGYASALAWIYFVVVLVFTIIQLRLSKRWVHYQGS